MLKEHGDLIFGGLQPKRALGAVKDELANDGFFLRTGIRVKEKGRPVNGFMVQRISVEEPEQVELGH